MKKFAMMVILAAAATAAVTTAMAADVGVRYSSNGNTLADNGGITINQNIGKYGVEGVFTRSSTGTSVDQYSLLGTYDTVSVLGLTVTSKAGFAYLQPTGAQTGYAAVVGAGVSIPVTKNVKAAVDYTYQRGQNRVSSFDGNTVSAGLKYSF